VVATILIRGEATANEFRSSNIVGVYLSLTRATVGALNEPFRVLWLSYLLTVCFHGLMEIMVA
jgi:hypothetical protein